MKIDGRALADSILTDLKKQVVLLAEKKIIPALAVILVGDNPGSLSYIKQKQKAADAIGAKLKLNHVSQATRQELQRLIATYNNDQAFHGLIVQRPMPSGMDDVREILASVNPKKDVDGFVPNSPFDAPVAAAVGEILKKIIPLSEVRKKNIVIVGRGETAGTPIARYFQKLKCATSIVHSQTPNPKEIMRTADILISCVGKSRVVTPDAVKPGAILMGVGIGRDDDAKLEGDYAEDEIKDIASFYTPTPGGVGPVNVACLMKNLLQAALS